MEMPKEHVNEGFARLVSGRDEDIDLARCALEIARAEYPELDVPYYLRRLDFLAEECRARTADVTFAPAMVARINEYLFGELGFKGDLENFTDPRNSYLNEVLDRRVGIPISLSVVFMEVARRLGLQVHGVSFPGHFLVRVECTGGILILDPFAGGKPLDTAELERRRMRVSFAGLAPPLDELLRPATRRAILARMLRNLKSIYMEKEDWPRALRIVNMMLAVTPMAPSEIRDRAYIHDQMDYLRAAVEDYQQYLVLSPGSSDFELVQTRLADLRRCIERLH
jgi:regulator of sirC expression with transglutaminase-like and TPR domain